MWDFYSALWVFLLLTLEYVLHSSFLLAKIPLSFFLTFFAQTSLLGSCFISWSLERDVSSNTFLLFAVHLQSPPTSHCLPAGLQPLLSVPLLTHFALHLHHMHPVLFPYSILIYIPPSLLCAVCLVWVTLSSYKKPHPALGSVVWFILLHYSSYKALSENTFP